MPSFKPKSNKKIVVDVNHQFTLDTKHSEYVEEFRYNDEKVIPGYKVEIQKCRKMLGSKTKLAEKIDLNEQIQIYEKKILELENKKTNYYLDNSKFIFDYFESKKKIEKTNSEEDEKKSLNSFFNKHDMSGAAAAAASSSSSSNTLFQSYLKNVDHTLVDLTQYYLKKNLCKYCLKGEMISMEDEGILLCNTCSTISKYLIENEKPSYREPPKEVCFYAYKKINHFKEILAQFQGKESTNIPTEVLENIKGQIKKERLDISNISYDELKSLLKKLGYNKYYEHINFIKQKLGIPCISIPQETEETLCNFFLEIQYPYARHCPDYRINFLHYYYVLYKLFQLLGEDQYLSQIPMLKDKDKLIEQDNIWKKICGDLNWEFIATV
jgi:Poxvirus Late Transcription Factor VLTF3 like